MLTRYKDAVSRFLQPVGSALAATGISPSALTVAGPILTALVCWWFIRTGAILPFCLVMGVVGCVDALDGAVARAGGRVTKFGGYLDAVCDRYVEAMVVIAAAVVTGHWTLSAVTLVGTFGVSYAKARASMEVAVSNTEWPDLMERTERSVVFLVGLAASALISWRPLGRDLFWWTLLFLAVLTHVTVLQRILRARRLIRLRA